ncbi:MAG: fibronectin type III domain-containing protein, partial [Bacteroidota bacterium]|nr:fibronectin type III domain-containing protein [Bacteroidota bacterium]
MKKLLLSMLMAILLAISGWSQNSDSTEVSVGLGNYNSTNTYVPVHLYYKNATTQTIYLASEIDMGGTISSISYYNSYSGLNTDRTIKVYMATTDIAQFNSASAALDSTDFTLVYDGTWNVVGQQWSKINLTTPFYYNGTSNLVIAFVDATGSYVGSGHYYQSTQTTGTYRSISKQNDSQACGFFNISSGDAKAYYPDIKITFSDTIEDWCHGLTNINVSDTTSSSFTISWAENSNASQYYYQIKRSQDSWIEDGDDYTSDTTVDFSDLQSSTTYDIRVKVDCGSNTSFYCETQVTTSCAAIDSVPITWDFEAANNTAGTSSYPLPSCWERTGASTSNPYSYSSSTNNTTEGGARVLYFYGKERYAVLPEIDTTLLPINTLQLSFYAKRGSTTANTLQIGVMTDPTDTNTFTLISTIEPTTNMEYYDVSLEDFEGYGAYIALRSGHLATSTTVSVYLDDLTLGLIPACSRPTDITTSVSTDEISLTWISTGSDFEVYYKESSATDWNTVTDFSNGEEDSIWTATISNLTSNTSYDLYIKAICDDGSEPASEEITLKTQCEQIDIPYTQNFESTTVGSRPDCWYFLNSYNGYPYVNNSTYRGHVSANGLEFHSQGTYANPSLGTMAVLPQFSTSIDQLSIEFWSRPESNPANNGYSSGRLEIGYVTDPTDASTFVMVDSISVFTLDDSAYHRYQINFDQIDLGDASYGYIAFRHVPMLTSWYWYVDDITVGEIPSCSMPSHLVSDSVMVYTAQLTWTADEELVTIYYKPSTATLYDSIESVSMNEDSIYLLENLLPNTTYDWYVSYVCSSDNEVYASEVSHFTTECVALTSVPQTWTFEATDNTAGTSSYPLPSCWQRLSGNYPYSYSYGAYEGSYALYFYGTGKVGILPSIDTTELPLNTLQLSFYAKRSSTYTSTLQVGVMTDPTDTNTFTLIDDFSLTTSYQRYEISLAAYTAGGNYIAFKTLSGSYASTYVDSVTLEVIPTCSKPQNLTITASSNGAELNWSSTGDDFEIYYKQASETTYSSITDFSAGSVSGTWSASITDMLPFANYDVFVKVACDDGDLYSDTLTIAFCTLIDSVPMTWDFEDSGNNTESYPLPLCWRRVDGSNYPYSYNSTSYAVSGTKVLYFYGYGVDRYAVLPEIDTTTLPINTLQLSFYAKRSATYASTLQIGVMTDPTDTSTFSVVSSIDLGSNHEYYDVSLASYTGTGSYICMRATSDASYTYAYVDDVKLDVIPQCSRPNNVIASVTENSATITWTSTGSDFEIYYKTSTDSDYTMISDFDSQEGEYSAWTTTLSNLTSSTNYDVWVKVICDDNSMDTSNIVRFATSCVAISSVPVLWNFEEEGNSDDGSYSLPLCWSRIGTGNYPYCNTSTSYAVSGTKVLYFYGANRYAVLPQVDVAELPMNTLQLSFYAKTTSTTGNTIQIGVMTSQTDTLTFSPISTIELSSNTLYYDVPLSSYTGTGSYIAIRSRGGSSAYAYIDDMTLDVIPACTRPNDITSTPSTESLTITWTSTGSDFEIYYKESGEETYVTTTNYSAGSESNTWTSTINGLNPTTNYDVYIKVNCNDATELLSNTETFATSCTMISTVPKTWDFETTGNTTDSYPLPLCWTRTGVTSNYPYSYTSASYAVSGSKVLYFYGANKYAVLPQIDTMELPINTLQLSFYARRGTSANTIQIGVMSSPTDTLTFSLISSLTLTNTSTYYEIPLDTYTGTGEYIAIRSYGGSSVYAYIDDVMLDIIPACTRPSDLTITTTSDQAVVTWKSSGDDFEIRYKKESETNYEIATDFSAGTEDSIWTTTLVGLEPSSLYDIYIVVTCDDGSQVSSFAETFRTQCTGVDVFPYTEDFSTLSDSYLGCWSSEIVSGSTDWTIKTITNNKTAYRSYTTGTTKLVSPVFDITSLSSPYISYNWEACNDASYYDSLFVYYRTNNTEDWTLLTSHGPTHSGSLSTLPSQFDSIALPNASATYQIAFEGRSHNGYGVYVDNVVIGDADDSPVIPVEPTVATNVASSVAQTS